MSIFLIKKDIMEQSKKLKSTAIIEEEEEEDAIDEETYRKNHSVCLICGGTPCDWTNYKDEVIFQMELYITNCCLVSEEELTQRRIRKVGYKTFTMEKYGFLGQGNRVKVPDCVTFEIRKLYPEEDSDEYMGYKPY